MSKIKLRLPDGTEKEFDKGITSLKIAESIGSRLAKAALAGKVNGQLVDLNLPIEEDSDFEIVTFDSDEGKKLFWHSSSHLMAQAVKELFPNAKTAIGPAIDEGFYYDFDVEKSFTPEDLEKIEKKMLEHVNANETFERKELTKKEALDFYKNNKYKTEIINEAKGEVSFYSNGNFTDLCRGPHLPSTAKIGAIKLMRVAGAYWRGSEKNKMLQRIYGITFPEKKMLSAYLTRLEEAKKRNHIKLGKELDIFSTHNEAPGFPFLHHNGGVLWFEIEKFMREQLYIRDYELVITPLILNKNLWLQSGHWDHYKENMYFTEIDNEDFAVKPMNCPGHMLIFKEKRHSYRDLPLKMGEFGIVHRHEKSGVLNGLFRVRKFTQDDAHIFCTEEQVTEQINELMELVDFIYKTLGFEKYKIELSTKPEKAMGSQEMWDKAETSLKKALDATGKKYTINEGDGAFYGPKIDFHIEDSLGRTWQCATIQLDFSMPEKFDLRYIGEDDKEHRPVMLHRTILGSMERFLGVLIEHFAGLFPTWLSPIQVEIMTINDSNIEFAKEIAKKLKTNFIRVETNLRGQSISRKVRDAQLKKIPYMLTIGDKEMENKTIAVRTRNGKVKFGMSVDVFIEKLSEEIKQRKLELTVVE